MKFFNLISISDFGRYALQGEYSMNKPNDIHEPTQPQQQKPTPTNNIPSLMSLSITPPIMATNIQPKSTTATSVIKEKYVLKNFLREYSIE
jgi:hypothetical protein